MKFLLFLSFIVLGLSQPSEKLSDDVASLCQAFFEWRVESLPQFATFIGIPDLDDQMDDLSPEGYAKRITEAESFLEQAKELQKNVTTHVDILNLKILIDGLETFLDGSKFNMHVMPVSNLEGPQTDYLNLLEWMNKQTVEDYDTMLIRMEGMVKQVDQIIDLMKEGMRIGVTLHKRSLIALQVALEDFIPENATRSPFYKHFEDLPLNFTNHEIKAVQKKAQELISQRLTPAMERLSDFISDEYKTREDIAISSVTNGEAMYKSLIKFHTSTNLTAEEIQKIGFSQVAEIEGKMRKIIDKMGHIGMSVQQFSNTIKNNHDNFYNTSEELMAGFNRIVHEIVPPKLNKIFRNIPKTELEVVPSPSESSPGAFYLTGAYDGSRPGVFYVNNLHPEAQPKYDMMTLSLHEGNPGHHFQGSYTLESDSIPFFRRVVDDRNYDIAPSKFPIYTSYLEGWGLYAESLGFDLGLYDDLLDRYGHYSQEIFRACRLVVDTGIHALGWTRQEAVEYMFKHSASTMHEIENEVDRYITWPGQALAYKIGELKFTELRHRGEEKLGKKFNIKDFHEVVLNAFGPMYIVEEEVDRWIASIEN